jgi:hypothetical protein
MLKTAWTTLFNRVVGGIASVRRAISRSKQAATERGQPPPSEDKQHYIPRFLFKGFASNYVSRKQVFVWCFKRDCSEGQEENTKDIGYEPDFYGVLLDDLIKKREDVYAKVLDRVRAKRKIQDGDRDQVVEFVFSLALRTKHAREKIISLIESSQDSLHSSLTDADRWTDGVRKKANHQYLREQFEQFARSKLGTVSRSRMNRLWERNKKLVISRVELEANKFGKEQARNWDFFFSVVRWDKLAEDFGEKGQVAALTNLHQNISLQPSDSLKLWKNLHWQVEEFPPGSLILGDAPVLQVNKDSSVVSVLFGGGERTMIVLPISHNLLLIGSEEPDAKLPALDVLNRSSAELSLLFFVSSQNRAGYEGVYHGLVGRRAPRQETESAAQVEST